MPCPTCEHTLQSIGYGMHHCPRCGTLVGAHADGSASVPAIVGRTQKLAHEIKFNQDCSDCHDAMRTLGLFEAAFPEGKRP